MISDSTTNVLVTGSDENAIQSKRPDVAAMSATMHHSAMADWFRVFPPGSVPILVFEALLLVHAKYAAPQVLITAAMIVAIGWSIAFWITCVKWYRIAVTNVPDQPAVPRSVASDGSPDLACEENQ